MPDLISDLFLDHANKLYVVSGLGEEIYALIHCFVGLHAIEALSQAVDSHELFLGKKKVLSSGAGAEGTVGMPPRPGSVRRSPISVIERT